VRSNTLARPFSFVKTKKPVALQGKRAKNLKIMSNKSTTANASAQHATETFLGDAAPFTAAEIMQGVGKEIERLETIYKPIPHDEVLEKLWAQIPEVSFIEAAELKDTDKLTRKHFHVLAVQTILETAQKNHWGLCRGNDFVYLFNGSFWKVLEKETLLSFMGEAAERMSIDKFDSRHYKFRDELLKQFLSVANLPKPTPPKGVVLMNFQNGTLEIGKGKQVLRHPSPNDFLTYQLPYAYDPTATAPLFQKFLHRVQPEEKCRTILAEYLAYVFVKTSTLKLEKVLLLYGTGANGKSVFFDVSKAIFGEENVSSYSLQSLTDSSGYYRSLLGKVLLNYASEINGRLETQYFKALASGEDLEARQPYGLPFVLRDYAKLIFNCNELPGEVEHTHAYFRRFLIIPFSETIPDAEQDKELSRKIIEAELPGIFNWVLDGLNRLLAQKRFTESDAAARQLEDFKRLSDNVRCFIEDESFAPSNEKKLPLKELYGLFRDYCRDNGAMPCALRKFAERLRHLGFTTKKEKIGQVVFVECGEFKG